MKRKIDQICFGIVLACLAMVPLFGLYLLKSALGLDLFEGPSFLHFWN